ncbi:hypothetical protein SEA_RIBEYE_81 [Gordonia phage Ribeye]|uniref:Uncharacterized protein n=1 Tax=Gordonia phage Ribeye TaxID=2250417 RepID=A0A345KPJ2_9CAUD|nr:hypothetical protein J1768_gp81 [Gordonia phage Ribeye]AXH44944.1 hypothetical protein SEA_RIBEYE_81 [Gordonia phage Ribeye]
MSRAVVFTAWASTVVEVPDDVEAETYAELVEWAAENMPYPSLCHQCGHEMSVGDFETDTVITADGTEYDVATGKPRHEP